MIIIKKAVIQDQGYVYLHRHIV